jgi:hypothetical protein
MKETLTDIKSKLQSGDYGNEEHVRLSLVARVLQKLDWNIWDPTEVNTEFVVVPNEDKTRVDLALFCRPTLPSVYIEIKAVGQMQGRLPDVERQVRDYNRNNTALFSVITDGRDWRFYYSQTAGEFSQKCFESFNLENDNIDDIERSLMTFLKKSEIANDNARREAETYLQLNQKQRAMEDCLPEARRLLHEPPFPSLPEALVSLVRDKGFTVSHEEAVEFIRTAVDRRPPLPIALREPEISRPDDTPPRRDFPVRALNPDNPENLFHTKITQAHFAGTSVSNWRELIDCAMKAALKNGVPFTALSGIANVRESNPRDQSFHQIEGTHLWMQGMDSNQAWKRSLALARKIRVDLKVAFFWRDKPEAVHPGAEGLLEWSPAR